MKLIYVANARIPTEKAHGLQTMKTCEAFARQGAVVELVLPKRHNPITEDPFTYYNIERNFKITKLPSFDLVRFGRIGFWIQRLTFLLAILPKLASREADVIYSRDILASFLAVLLGEKRVAYEDHEPISSTWYAFLLHRIPYKVVVAANLLALYESPGVPTDRVLVAPNGVDLAEFDKVVPDPGLWNRLYDIPRETRIVLYVGHFYRWKGIYTLLDAAPHLGDGIAVVCIGGTAEDRAAVERYCADRALNNVRIVPFLKHNDVIRHMKSAHVLVLPNTGEEERSLRYTTPLKLFEYMVSGVPIVASRIPSLEPYLVDGENAILIDPDNPEQLAAGIKKIFDEPEAACRRADVTHRDVKKYSWQERARSILSFMRGTPPQD